MEELACNACLEVRRDSRILQCGNGHLVCEHCYPTVAGCSVCNVALPKPRLRNILAEASIKKLVFRCQNDVRGCNFEPSDPIDLDAHAKECQFGPVVCPACFEEQPRNGLLDHLKNAHELNEFGCDDVARVEVADSDRFPWPIILQFENRVVIVVIRREAETFLVYGYDHSEQKGSDGRLFVSLEAQNVAMATTAKLAGLPCVRNEIRNEEPVMTFSRHMVRRQSVISFKERSCWLTIKKVEPTYIRYVVWMVDFATTTVTFFVCQFL